VIRIIISRTRFKMVLRELLRVAVVGLFLSHVDSFQVDFFQRGIISRSNHGKIRSPAPFSRRHPKLWSKQDQGPKKKQGGSASTKKKSTPSKKKVTAKQPARRRKPQESKGERGVGSKAGPKVQGNKAVAKVKGESWIDKEERLATEAYEKFVERKAARKEREVRSKLTDPEAEHTLLFSGLTTLFFSFLSNSLSCDHCSLLLLLSDAAWKRK
jgi:hypothetical protein